MMNKFKIIKVKPLNVFLRTNFFPKNNELLSLGSDEKFIKDK